MNLFMASNIIGLYLTHFIASFYNYLDDCQALSVNLFEVPKYQKSEWTVRSDLLH